MGSFQNDSSRQFIICLLSFFFWWQGRVSIDCGKVFPFSAPPFCNWLQHMQTLNVDKWIFVVLRHKKSFSPNCCCCFSKSFTCSSWKLAQNAFKCDEDGKSFISFLPPSFYPKTHWWTSNELNNRKDNSSFKFQVPQTATSFPLSYSESECQLKEEISVASCPCLEYKFRIDFDSHICL